MTIDDFGIETRAEIDTQLENLLGYVADEHYEAWSAYWDDEEEYRDKIIVVLREWQEKCRTLGE